MYSPQSILAHVMDSLRRVDAAVSLSFRAHCVVALAGVFSHTLHALVRAEAAASYLAAQVRPYIGPYITPTSPLSAGPRRPGTPLGSTLDSP